MHPKHSNGSWQDIVIFHFKNSLCFRPGIACNFKRIKASNEISKANSEPASKQPKMKACVCGWFKSGKTEWWTKAYDRSLKRHRVLRVYVTSLCVVPVRNEQTTKSYCTQLRLIVLSNLNPRQLFVTSWTEELILCEYFSDMHDGLKFMWLLWSCECVKVEKRNKLWRHRRAKFCRSNQIIQLGIFHLLLE